MVGKLVLFGLCVSACFAQQYEIGGAIGYGWYRNGTIFGPGASATAGIRNRFAAGAIVGEDLYQHISGEVRYMYHDGHPFLQSGGVKTDVQGESHTFTYDVLIHAAPREARLRPFVAAGAGAKDYVISGPAPRQTVFPGLGSITTRDEWKFVASVGGGIKFRLAQHLLLRADFRDYLSAFPKRQLAPAAGNTARGIFQQFTPMFGVSYFF